MPTSGAFTAWMQGLSELGVYLFLALSGIIENIFPPYPGDTVTVFCGFLAARGVIALPWAFVAVLVGNLIGAWIMYFAGDRILAFARRLHTRFERPRFVKKSLAGLVSEESMARTQGWFNKWGILFVFFSRFSAGVRFFVSIIAGISRMNFFLFSLAFAAGVLVWNVILLFGGYMLGDNWELILHGLRVYNQVVFSLLALLALLYFYWRWRRKRRQA